MGLNILKFYCGFKAFIRLVGEECETLRWIKGKTERG